MNVGKAWKRRVNSRIFRTAEREFSTMASAYILLIAAAMSPAAVGVVNGTGADIRSVEVRDSARGNWTGSAMRASDGARTNWSFDDERCAYDLKVTLLNGDTVVFSGVNPCDAKQLTLRRNGANAWVDYD